MRTIYVEHAVLEHPRTLAILQRFKQARVINIERFGEVFNPKAQNFRLQKQEPALILAHKHSNHVLKAPPEYNIGGKHNYYFSHMMNCVYDCRYCFLQGMFSSANYVVFVNFEDFFAAITRQTHELGEPAWYFSGYDCDSLAYDPVTRFCDASLDFFADQPQSSLELRTKSTQIRGLLRREPIANCVVAFSLSPTSVVNTHEHKTPDLQKRLDALVQLQQAGWKTGLRIDPLIYTEDFRKDYQEFFSDLFARVDADALHSVSLGTFRLPPAFHKRMVRLYPDEALLAQGIKTRGIQTREIQTRGMQSGGIQTSGQEPSELVGYPADLELDMMDWCATQLSRHVDNERLFRCV